MFDWTIQGFIFLAGGIFLAITLPSLFYADKVNFVTWTGCTLWCLAGGLSFVGVAADVMYLLSLVGCVVTTLGVTYMMLDSLMSACYYVHLPMGKPFKEMSQADGSWE